MKKVLLTAMTILSVASASVFGMYGNDNGWIDFLVHGNQLRARMNQFGVTIGNGTIKGTFGFKGETSGVIVDAVTGKENADANVAKLAPTLSAGIGYTSPAFGIGVGYNYTYIGTGLDVHTPVLAINAMNDMIRIALPFQVAAGDETKKNSVISTKEKYTGFSMDPHIRIYPGIDAVSQIRLTVKYGMVSYKQAAQEYAASSFGFEFRVNFLKTTVGNVILDPFFRVKYNTAIEGNSTGVVASSHNVALKKGDKPKHTPYNVQFDLPLGLSANSDVVSLYLEPALGYGFSQNSADGSIKHALTWGAYSEIYITPVKDLEFYFEANIGNSEMKGGKFDNGGTFTGFDKVYFESSTGITWYLPSFNGAE